MRILLVQPPHHNPAFAFAYATEALGLETVAGSLEYCEVEFLDQRFDQTPIDRVLARFSLDIVGTGGFEDDRPWIRKKPRATWPCSFCGESRTP